MSASVREIESTFDALVSDAGTALRLGVAIPIVIFAVPALLQLSALIKGVVRNP